MMDMENNRMFHGCLGTDKHEELIDIIRGKALTHLSELGEIYCITDQNFITTIMGMKTHGKGKKDTKVPDVLLASPKGDVLLIEIGTFNPDKWGPHIPVIHIGFNYIISLVNPTGSPFEHLVAAMIEIALEEEGLYPELDPIPLEPDAIFKRMESLADAAKADNGD